MPTRSAKKTSHDDGVFGIKGLSVERETKDGQANRRAVHGKALGAREWPVNVGLQPLVPPTNIIVEVAVAQRQRGGARRP